jgi:hypothetical protein
LAELLAMVGDAVAGLLFDGLEHILERGFLEVEREPRRIEGLLSEALANLSGNATQPGLHLLRHAVVRLGELIEERVAGLGAALEAELDEFLLGRFAIGGGVGVELLDELFDAVRRGSSIVLSLRH